MKNIMYYTIFTSFSNRKLLLKVGLLFNIITLVSCNSPIHKKVQITDCQEMNLKGNVCCIVEKEFDSNPNNSEQIPSLYKFNKDGNILFMSHKDEIIQNSYDEKGNKKVKKIRTTSKAERDWGTNFSDNIYTYIKYFHNEDGFVTKEEEYFSILSLNEPYLCKLHILDKNNYITKSIKYSDRDNQTGLFKDSLITNYKIEFKDNSITELIQKNEEEKRIVSTYDPDTRLLISRHTKDLFVYTETLNEFVKNENNELVQKTIEHNKNELVRYQYDHNKNISCIQISDSTKNIDLVYNFKYEYDENSNWIRKECYDHLYNLISYYEREIEYYPINEIDNSVDFSWENEKSPLEINYEKEREIRQKENLYLNDRFVLSAFEYEMKKEYSNYKIIGTPQITLRNNREYYINFNCREKNYGYKNENITVLITINIEDDTYSFKTVKGVLL